MKKKNIYLISIISRTMDRKLNAKISEIVKNGDLTFLTVKKIKQQLVEEFGSTLVAEKGDSIKKFVAKCVTQRS
jgi:DEK-like protein